MKISILTSKRGPYRSSLITPGLVEVGSSEDSDSEVCSFPFGPSMSGVCEAWTTASSYSETLFSPKMGVENTSPCLHDESFSVRFLRLESLLLEVSSRTSPTEINLTSHLLRYEFL